MRDVIGTLGGKLKKASKLLKPFGITLDSLLEGAVSIDNRIGVGRLRNASLELTLEDLSIMATEIKEALGEDALKKLTVTFGEKMGSIDLVEDLLVFKDIPIKKAVINERVHRSTDTDDAFEVLTSLASKNLKMILGSYNAYFDRLPFKSSSK